MYRKRAGGWLKHLDFIVLDILCLQAAFLLAFAVCTGLSSPYANDAYQEIGIILLLACICVTLLSDAFSGVLKRGRYEEFAAMLEQACLIEAVIIICLFTLQKEISYSRFIIYLTGVLYVCIGYFVRCLWKAILSRRRSVVERHSLLVVTEQALAEQAVKAAMEPETV